jgi:hypothetical protein
MRRLHQGTPPRSTIFITFDSPVSVPYLPHSGELRVRQIASAVLYGVRIFIPNFLLHQETNRQRQWATGWDNDEVVAFFEGMEFYLGRIGLIDEQHCCEIVLFSLIRL